MKAIAIDIFNDKTKSALKNYLCRYMSAFDYIQDKAVLDIPCGSGFGASLFKHFTKDVVGADLDDELIKYAKDSFNIDVVKCNMRHALPFNDNSFDVITCFEGIEHIDFLSAKKFIQELKRITRPGGLFLGTTPDCKLTVNDTTKADQGHFCLYSRDRLLSMLCGYSGQLSRVEIFSEKIDKSFLWKCLVNKEIIEVPSISIEEWFDCQLMESDYWKERYSEKPYLGVAKFTNDEALFDSFIEFSRGKIVADVGSGPIGGIIKALDCKLGFAIDPLSSKYIQMGWTDNLDKYIPISSPAEVIPLPSNYVDVVHTMNALDHVRDINKCMQEIHRILKAGGRIYLNVDIRNSLQVTRGHKIAVNQNFFYKTAESLNLKILYDKIEHFECKNTMNTFVGVFEKS